MSLQLTAPIATTPTQRNADRIRIASVRDTDLPTMSDAMAKALRVINSPDAVLSDLIAIVRKDGSLTTAILKLANCPVFMRQRTVDRIDQAIIFLGMKTCRQVISSIWMRSTFSLISPELRERCELLSRHSFLTASLATSINEFFGMGFRGEEFTAGLLHDIGRLLLAVIAPDDFDQADPMTFREDPTVLDYERAVMGLDHCSLGATYANRYNLPDSIVSSIELHHSPCAAGEQMPLVAITSAADHLANHIKAERNIRHYDPVTNEGWLLLFQKFGEERLDDLWNELSPMTVRAIRESRALSKAPFA